mmetsp:Transcript_23990/g.44103  ORF Transcript_23990/g.44103 Transcript_23990/m.44103 type:complete len:814 (-) Transcript_23990:48-2489(-)
MASFKNIEELAYFFCKDSKMKIGDMLDRNPKFLTDVMNEMNLLHHLIRGHAASQGIAAVLNRKPQQAEALVDSKLPFFILLERPDLEADDAESLRFLLRANPQVAFINDDGLNALVRLFMSVNFPQEMVRVVRDLLDYNPEAASQEFGVQQLPLHLCLTGSKPSDCVVPVIKAYPAACSKPYRGVLPLHMAVEHDLDLEVQELILKHYPQAMLQLVKGMNCTLLEYAIRTQKNTATQVLFSGGGKNPKCIAYAAAQIDGMTGEEESFAVVKKQIDVQHHLIHGAPYPDRPELNATFEVKPYAFEPFVVTMAADALVEDLEKLIHLMEGTPPERQKLTNTAGGRLLRGEPIEGHLRDSPVHKILPEEMAQRKRIYHNYVYEIEESSLPLITLTPNSDLFCDCIEAQANEIAHDILALRPALVFEQDHWGALPLHKALREEPIPERFVEELLIDFPEAARTRSGSSVNSEYAIDMAIHNYAPVSILRRLISYIKPSDWSPHGCFCPEGEDDVDKRPLLHLAIEHDLPPKLIFMLVDSGYPFWVVDKATGLSALEFAVSLRGHPAFVHQLMERAMADGVQSALWSGPSGKTLLHIACASKASPDTIAHICRLGGHTILRARDDDGRIPLHIAVEMGLAHDGVRELMMCDPQILFERDAHGRMALHLAVMNNAAPGVVFELARCGPQAVKIKDARGRSLLRLAVLTDVTPHIVHELLEACPELLDEVNLFDSKWPSNAAGREVKRLALAPRPDRRSEKQPVGPYEAARHHVADGPNSSWQTMSHKHSTAEESSTWDTMVGTVGLSWLLGSSTTSTSI